MNVLVWSADPGIRADGPTGAGEHLREVTAALARAGHSVTLSAAGDPRWPRGVRTLGARLDAHLRWRRTPAVDLVWERFHPASRAAARSGTPRWVEVNAPGALERRWPREPRDVGRERAILGSADRVLVVSRWLAQWAVDVAGVPASRVTWLPNGVPAAPPGDRAATRDRLALDGPTLVFVGSLHRWQGASFVPRLLDALPEFRALVVGDGPFPPPPHARMLRTGRVPGHAVPDLIAAADVGLAPYEPLGPPWYCPLKILRYRAEGLPALATDLGDCRALGATVLPDRDVDRWAAACRAALTGPRSPQRRTWDTVVGEAFASATW